MDEVSHKLIKQNLKKELKTHLEHSWCIGKITKGFLATMDRVLWLYSLVYDPGYLMNGPASYLRIE